MARPIVAIKKITRPISDEAITAAVRDAWNSAAAGALIFEPGASVVVKPNIFAPLMPPVTTDPRTAAAVVRVAVEMGAREVIVAEGRSISTAKFRPNGRTTRACAELTGMDKAVETAGGRMLYLEDDEFVEVDVPGAEVLKTVRVPRTILEAEVLINLPVMKIHSLMFVTLGIKNLHGCISDEDKLFGHSYEELANKLPDFLRVRRPDLTIIDGVAGLEGDHSDVGVLVDMGLIIAGRDVVAVDAVTGAVMGFENLEVDTTRIAGEFGLGEADLNNIEVVGETIEAVRRPFARPDIDMQPGRFPGVEIIAGDFCRSCLYYTRRGLDKLMDCGLLSEDRKLTLVLGKEPPVPDRLDGKVIMLGDCCLRSKSIRRLRDHLLLEGRLQTMYACPPMEFRIRAKELVGD